MIGSIITQKLAELAPLDAVEQENVLAEILQHYVLASLARARLFDVAEFHGGTFLRILHGLERFSEDLDFVLKRPDPTFAWDDLLDHVQKECAYDGIPFEVSHKKEPDKAVQKAFLKTSFPGALPGLELRFKRHPGRKIRIKLEVDTNPPAGSKFEIAYLSFPTLYFCF